jgi:hypothetical protein
MSTRPAQGIEGRVLWVSGNQLPGPKRNVADPEPVVTTVWIFSGKIPGQDPYWPVSAACQHPNWYASVVSDASGRFLIGLPSGEYTVFAQYDASLYLNAFADPRFYQSVQVVEGQWTPVELINTEEATF